MRTPALDLSPINAATLRDANRRLLANGIVRLPPLLAAEDQQLVLAEATRLLSECGQRRDFNMRLTDGSPRRMRNVGGNEIMSKSPMLANLYDSSSLRDLVSAVIGESALTCPYARERIVITSLHQQGDTHGWHWDDYSIALIWVLQAPPVDCGGLVQCIPHTRWNREAPQILEHLVASPIHTYYFGSGEAYLMQTRNTLHRVHPLVKPSCERIIMNFAFATRDDADVGDRHETVDALWATAE
jgi:hypothetical protein